MRGAIFRSLAATLFLFVTVFGASPKTPAKPEAVQKQIQKLMDREKYDDALSTLQESRHILPPVFVTNALLQIYPEVKSNRQWKDLLDALPPGTNQELGLAFYYQRLGWLNEAQDHFRNFFERGGNSRDVEANGVALLSSTMRVPCSWLLEATPKDTGREFTKSYNFTLPYGASFGFLIFDGTLRSSSVEDVNRWIKNLFQNGIDTNLALREVSYKPTGGSFHKSLGQPGKAADPEGVLVGLEQDHPNTKRRHFYGLLVPDRGVPFHYYEFSRSGVWLEFSYFYGGREEVVFKREMEEFLTHLISP